MKKFLIGKISELIFDIGKEEVYAEEIKDESDHFLQYSIKQASQLTTRASRISKTIKGGDDEPR